MNDCCMMDIIYRTKTIWR